MKTTTITVSYGQTVPGDRQFESERFDMTVTMETESEKEQSPRRVGQYLDRLMDEVKSAVEEKSGKKMRRKTKEP